MSERPAETSRTGRCSASRSRVRWTELSASGTATTVQSPSRAIGSAQYICATDSGRIIAISGSIGYVVDRRTPAPAGRRAGAPGRPPGARTRRAPRRGAARSRPLRPARDRSPRGASGRRAGRASRAGSGASAQASWARRPVLPGLSNRSWSLPQFSNLRVARSRPAVYPSNEEGLAGQRDLAEAVRTVDVAAAERREPQRDHLSRDDRDERAQPLRSRARQWERRVGLGKEARVVRDRDDRGSSLAQLRYGGAQARQGGPRRREQDHGPLGPERRDRPVEEVGRGERLERRARQLPDLQRDLERRPVVDAARDDDAAGRAAIAVHQRGVRERAFDLLGDPLGRLCQLVQPCAAERRRQQRDRADAVQVRLRGGDGTLFAGVQRQRPFGGLGERGGDVVRDRERRAALAARFLEHGDDVGRGAGLRDRDRGGPVEPGRRLVQRVERGRRERDRIAVARPEQVLRVARGVRRAAAGDDQEVADVGASELAGEPDRVRRLRGEQPPECRGLFPQLSFDPRHPALRRRPRERSRLRWQAASGRPRRRCPQGARRSPPWDRPRPPRTRRRRDRTSTRLNSSHEWISYAVFCLKKKKKTILGSLFTKKKKKKLKQKKI